MTEMESGPMVFTNIPQERNEDSLRLATFICPHSNNYREFIVT